MIGGRSFELLTEFEWEPPTWVIVSLIGTMHQPEHIDLVRRFGAGLSTGDQRYIVVDLSQLVHMYTDVAVIYQQCQESMRDIDGLLILTGVQSQHRHAIEQTLHAPAETKFWIVQDRQRAAELVRQHHLCEINQLVFPHPSVQLQTTEET